MRSDLLSENSEPGLRSTDVLAFTFGLRNVLWEESGCGNSG